MQYLIHHGIVLAQQSRFESIKSGFRSRRTHVDTQDLVTGLVTLAGVCTALVVISYFVNRHEQRRTYTSPRRLFWTLCKAHRLHWPQRWLLWRLARAQQLGDPARLFLEPERLEPVGLGPTWDTRAAELRHLRQRIFAETESDDPAHADDWPTPSAGPPPSGHQ